MGNGPHFRSHEGINHQSKQISPSQRLLLHKPAVVLRASAGQNVGVGMGRKLRGHRGAERAVDDVMATRLLSRLGHTLQGGWDGGRDSRQNSHDNDIGDTNAQDDLADQGTEKPAVTSQGFLFPSARSSSNPICATGWDTCSLGDGFHNVCFAELL